MSICASGGRIIVSFREIQVHGAPALGGYLLKFLVHYQVPGWDDDSLSVSRLCGKVYLLGDKGGYIGRAFPEVPVVIKSQEYPQDGSLSFELFLSSQQIEEIEKRRCGGDIQFKLSIVGEWTDARNRMHCSEDVTFRVNQKSWIDALRQMNYGSFILYELPLTDEEARLTAACSIFRSAQEHLYYGNYDDVVAKCRMALESVLPSRDELRKVRDIMKSNKESLTKQQRFQYAVDSMTHYTHLAHHMDNDGKVVSYSRAEAIFVLGVTAAAISSTGELA